jgi:hypothetical protein
MLKCASPEGTPYSQAAQLAAVSKVADAVSQGSHEVLGQGSHSARTLHAIRALFSLWRAHCLWCRCSACSCLPSYCLGGRTCQARGRRAAAWAVCTACPSLTRASSHPLVHTHTCTPLCSHPIGRTQSFTSDRSQVPRLVVDRPCAREPRKCRARAARGRRRKEEAARRLTEPHDGRRRWLPREERRECGRRRFSGHGSGMMRWCAARPE